MATEESLIGRIRFHDQEVLAEIYDLYASMIYSIALRILREQSAAEKVMREVFLHVWRNPGEYNRQRGPLWARLVLAGRNRAIDRLRQRKPERSTHDVVIASCFDFDALSEREGALQEMRQAISSLPAIQQQVLDCAFFEGLTLMDIAAPTSEPLTSIKAHLRCALLSLRNAIHEKNRSLSKFE